MADLSKLSDADLQHLYSITQLESKGVPDSSTIKSDKGASGSMQVEPASAADPGYGVKPSNGTPQDTARMGRDYYLALQDHYKDPMVAAMAYNWGPGNVDKWQANGSNLKDVPDETLKYAHNFNQMNPQQQQAALAQPQSAGTINKPTVDAAQQRIQAGEANIKSPMQAGSNALTGLGEVGASMASGMFGQAAGLLHGAADLATGSDYHTAKQDFQKETQAVTYDPRTDAGQEINKNVGEMFDKYLVQPMRTGAQTAMSAIPFVGEDLAKSPLANEIAGDVGEATANIAPMMLGLHEAGKPGAVEAGAASELDKMGNLGQPALTPDSMGPNMGPQQPSLQGQPNAGPPRPAFTVDSRGNVTNPLENPDMPTFMQAAADRQARAQQEAGTAMGPNEGPQLGQSTEPPVMLASAEGEVGTPEQFAAVQPFRDEMARRTSQLQGMSQEQLSLLDSVEQHPEPVRTEDQRALGQDEFEQTVQSLGDKDGARFPMPDAEDPYHDLWMQAAYDHYLNTIRDEQGQLFNSGDMARRFAENARKEALDRQVSNHPVVKANQARLDQLLEQQDNGGSKRGNANLQSQIDAAQKTLDKSKDNIGKFMGNDPRLPYEKDGVVNMFTFGNIPEIFRSIKAVLQMLHNVAFKMIDKAMPTFRNLDNFAQIKMQGMKDAANRLANKDWTTQVNEQPKQVMKGVPGLREGLKDYLPFEAQEDLDPAALKQKMQQAPDLGGGKLTNLARSQFMTGQQLQAFSKHPLVKLAVETVDRAMRDSAQFVRQQLVGRDGLREKIRAMSSDERTGIWNLMQMNEGVREFSEAELKGAGYSDKQVAFYKQRLELNKMKLDSLNRGRAQAGLAPVDARIAHIAGHFLGDFKRLITDADGKVKAVIAHNNRAAVEVITKRVMDQLGEGHSAGPIDMRKLSEASNVDRYTGYMNILNDMDSRDPVIAAVVNAYKEYMTNDAQTAMRYRAAFKSKEGVIGAEGRKSWQSAELNAKEGFKNELKSLEAMNTWANMQDALAKIKDFQADPEIDAPNAKMVTQRYLDDVQRRNQGSIAAFTNSMINGVADITGVGPSSLKHMSNVTKEGLLTMFIGLGKLSHSFVTLIQPLQGIPVVNSLMKAEGSKLGLSQLTAAVKSFGTQGSILEALARGGDVKDPFLRKALQFARDNDTFNSSQFQFGNLTDTNSGSFKRNFWKVAEFNVTGMESATRSFTYMYYAHMLKDLGMKESEIFPTAHNAMKDVMVDYNSWERPGVFGKLGFLGDLTAMLTRYKFNQIDQAARATKYAAGGQLGPMATVIATSIAAAGVRGLMAYTVANKLVQATTTWAAQNNLMQKPTSLDELLLHALHGKNQNLSDALKFGLPSALGINMTGSLSHADDIPNDPLGSLVPQSEPLLDMAKSLYGVARQPNAANAKTAFYDVMPNSTKGMIENHMFTDANGKYTNPHNYELQTIRTPADQAKREFGFRPMNEARDSLTQRVATDQRTAEGSVKNDITQRVLREMDSNGGRIASTDLRPYIQKYVDNEGNPNELFEAMKKHVGVDQARTAAQRAQGIPRNLSSIFNYERTEKLK